LIRDHRLVQAIQMESPNHNERPAGQEIDLLVIHNISLPPGKYGGSHIDDFFCNRLHVDQHPYFAGIADMHVSAHLLIRRDGQVHQYVPFDRRAWHAGKSSFCGRESCNDFSIGIELEGCDEDRFTAAQYAELVGITRLLQQHYPGITANRIVGHSDIAPGRKTDPGPGFDWDFFRASLLDAKEGVGR
jgi:N-acetyl-anhydromuramoyl-L-alanine amidase